MAKEEKKKNKNKNRNILSAAAASVVYAATPRGRKTWKKRKQRILAGAGVLVVLLNMWKDHKDAIFRTSSRGSS